MKVVFNDGVEKPLPDEWTAARLIVLSQKKDGDVGYKVRLDENLSQAEAKKQLDKIQAYVDYLRVKNR